MKLTPRAGGERGSAAAPVLQAGETCGGSGLLRPRGWTGGGHCPCSSLASATSAARRTLGSARREGGRGVDAFSLPRRAGAAPAPPLAFYGGGLGHPNSTRVTCCSRHRGERRVGLAPPTSRFTYGISFFDYDDGGGGGGSSGQEVPGAAAQPAPSGAFGLPGCPPAQKWYRV